MPGTTTQSQGKTMKPILATLLVLSSVTVAQAPPTASSAVISSIAEANDVTPGQLQYRATDDFLGGMGDLFNIAPARIAEWMDTVGLPGPSAYFTSTVIPLGEMAHEEKIYFFQATVWGDIYVRLGGPKGIKAGIWATSVVLDKIGRIDACKLTIKLIGFDFWADFDFSKCSPLETLRTDYFHRAGLLGSVSLTPGC